MISGKSVGLDIDPIAETEPLFPKLLEAMSIPQPASLAENPTSSPTTIAPISSGPDITTSIRPNEVSLRVQFDPVLKNIQHLLSGLNVGWADFGIVNSFQFVVIFGAAEEIAKAENRFKAAFEALEELQVVNRAWPLNVSTSVKQIF